MWAKAQINSLQPGLGLRMLRLLCHLMQLGFCVTNVV